MTRGAALILQQRDLILDLIVLLYAFVVVVAFLVVPGIQEYRRVRRLLAIRQEMDAARAGATHGDPGRFMVSDPRPRPRPEDRAGRTLPPVSPVPVSNAGRVLGYSARPAYPDNIIAFRRELARRGASLDDLRIER